MIIFIGEYPREKAHFVYPRSGLNKEQLDTPAPDSAGREAERLAALDHLNAIQPETDHILQQLVDEVRSIFGTDLCMVNLNLSDVQYFRAWSGELPAGLAEARQDALEHSMCRYVVDSEIPLAVTDFSATEEFREQHWCVNYGIHFYAGIPLITSDTHAIGTLCLLNTQPIEFGKDQMRVLGGFAQAVVGRLELLGALGREQAARQEEALRKEALRESEERYRKLFDSIDEGFAIIEMLYDGQGRAVDYRILETNPAFGRMTGFADAAGKTSLELNPDAEPYWFETLGRVVETGEDVRFENYAEALDQWFDVYASRVGGEDSRRIAIVFANITERKRAEEALRESEATLNAILNNLAEGVLVADTQGHVVFVNSAARSMLGVPDEESLEELPDPWEGFDLPEAVAHCSRHKESIEAGVRYEETFLRIKVECLVELEQSRGEVLVVIQDLSEGRQLEANQQRFLANADHQLRTPIMAIVGAAELLATGENADPAIERRLLNHIFSEGRRMQRLSEVLLRLSRIGWDRREPDLDIVDLREAGQQATRLMEPLAESGGLRILTEGEGSCVRADPDWLQEVLMVLLSNAIKHSNRGGDITVRTRSGAIAVQDEGAGISAVDLPHIFERFYRGTGSSEGFGLGLSICKDLTERMGGSISIRSREGVGTAVEIELPEASIDA